MYGYEDGHSYGWFPIFEGPHVPTFYTEVLKLFTPYQGGALNVVTEQTHDGFASVVSMFRCFELPRHGVVKLQQVCCDVFQNVDVQLFESRK